MIFAYTEMNSHVNSFLIMLQIMLQAQLSLKFLSAQISDKPIIA